MPEVLPRSLDAAARRRSAPRREVHPPARGGRVRGGAGQLCPGASRSTLANRKPLGQLELILSSEIREGTQMHTVRVGKRAQMVVPAVLRRRLGIEEGDVLQADIDDQGRLVLEVVPADPVERLRRAGAGMYGGRDGMEEQERLRSDWDGR